MTPKYLAISDMSKKIALRQRRFRIAGQREEHGYLTVGQLKVNGMKDSLNSYDASADDLNIDGRLILGDHKRNVIKADIAILKSAYLYAFYKLGYKYILSTKLNAIRKQIQNPNEDILPQYYLQSDHIDEKRQDDVYIATINGEEILAVLLTLKLPKSERIHRYIIIMPTENERDLDFYNRLHTMLKDKSSFEMQFIGIKHIS